MYGVFVEVNADESHVEAARKFLPAEAVPMARASGATAGYWLAPLGGRGVSVVVFNTEVKRTQWPNTSRSENRRSAPGLRKG